MNKISFGQYRAIDLGIMAVILFAVETPVAGLQQLNTKFNFNSVFVGNSHDLDHRRGNLTLFFKR